VSKLPLDPFPYPQDSRSKPAHAGMPDGLFAYFRDENGIVWVTPDGPHIHPKVLGGGRPASYAGDMSIAHGTISDLTNLSGTFGFDDPDGLLATADQCTSQELIVSPGAVRFFPGDGSPPRVLR
jgi:hypothetical protein